MHLAKAIAAGTATVINLTPRQAATLLRVPPSAVCTSHRKARLKKPLKQAWDAASVDERQDLIMDEIVLPLAD